MLLLSRLLLCLVCKESGVSNMRKGFIRRDKFDIDQNSSFTLKGIAFSDFLWKKAKIPTPSTFSVLCGHPAYVPINRLDRHQNL